MKKKIAIIGGGASGLTAACAIGNFCNITIFEHGERVGKKILQTGGGHCNIMNDNIDKSRYYSENQIVMEEILKNSKERILNFFKDIGLFVYTKDEEGRMYPSSNSASAVLDVLRFNAQETGAKIVTGFSPYVIKKTKSGFLVIKDNDSFEFDEIILACGGMAAPKTGSDGSGYELACNFGHTLINPRPVLAALKSDTKFTSALQGVRCRVNISLYEDFVKIKEESGEIQFTNYGISGIAAMQLSRFIKSGKHKAVIDFAPDNTQEEVFENIKRGKTKNRVLENALVGMVAKKPAMQIIKKVTSLSLQTLMSEIGDDVYRAIAKNVKNLSLDIQGTLSWDNAQVTRGGISLDDINPKTMQSTKCKGLYIIGEMLDCDGECGGYNLAWAFNTALIAAEAVRKGEQKN